MSNQAINDNAINEVLKSINYMIQTALKKTTQCYNGLVVSSSNNGKWNVQYNGEVHSLPVYGAAVPTLNSLVKVIIPQGNQALAWFFVPVESSSGGDGATFIPSVSNDGIISWTNDGGLPNPNPVNIKGPQGETGNVGPQGPQGDIGPQGLQGDVGPYFTPVVDNDGNLSWTNNGSLPNPTTVNIKGPQGIQGIQGETGPQGIKGDTGPQGSAGPYFTPSVSSEGVISWTNNGGLQNPISINIKGPQGPQGEQGPAGASGSDGIAATIKVGTVTTGNPGTQATITNVGTSNAAVFNFTIPQGAKGDTGATGPQGEQGIRGPQGLKGDTGDIGPQGPAGANGKNAYQYAQDGGFTGSESEFSLDLSGLQNGPFLPLTGGTLSGNLTGQYITGTWLQGTASNQLNSTPQRICVQDSDGLIYSRTPSQILGDIGAAPNYTYSTTDLTAGSSSLTTGTIYLVYE